MKPPTQKMVEVLMDCHERELLHLEPYDAGSVHFATGLIQRGMIGTRAYITEKGKNIMAFYVTYVGKSYLKNI